MGYLLYRSRKTKQIENLIKNEIAENIQKQRAANFIYISEKFFFFFFKNSVGLRNYILRVY
jgi:hypothetical protein